MAISDRIAVMSQGKIQHVGTPKDIYQRPANLFVATFIGKTNIIRARSRVADGQYLVVFDNGYSVPIKDVRPECLREEDVLASIRPEEMLLRPVARAGEGGGLRGVISDSIFLGLNTHYAVTLETGESAEIIQESQIDSILPPGSEIVLDVNAAKLNVFSGANEESVMADVANDMEVSSS